MSYQHNEVFSVFVPSDNKVYHLHQGNWPVGAENPVNGHYFTGHAHWLNWSMQGPKVPHPISVNEVSSRVFKAVLAGCRVSSIYPYNPVFQLFNGCIISLNGVRVDLLPIIELFDREGADGLDKYIASEMPKWLEAMRVRQ